MSGWKTNPLPDWFVPERRCRNIDVRVISFHPVGYPLKLKTPRIWPTKKIKCAVCGPCFVLEGYGPSHGGPEAPDSFCGGLIRLAGSWYVLRGPDSLCRALIPPAAPWFLPRRPDSSRRRPHPSRGALLVPRGTDSSCGP